MIDIQLIRSQPELVQQSSERRGSQFSVMELVELDRKRRAAILEIDTLRAKRNEVSREISGGERRSTDLIEEMRNVGSRIKLLEQGERDLASRLEKILLDIPNLPSESSPEGLEASSNTIVRRVGELPTFDFEPKPHWEIGQNLGIIDSQRAVKLSQTRFYVLKGEGAILQRALINWMLNFHTMEHKYTELYLPYMVNRATVIGSSHLPHFEENMYHDREDDLFMVPTAEAPITGLFRDEIIDASELPMRFVAHTPCWRREKFSAGRDTRGIKRVHQFDKVELYKFVVPETSYAELESLVKDAEEVCIRLGIPHRVLELCAGDLGFAASKSYDVEMWGAGSQEWLEVSSCSNCTDFQSRRSAIRYRPTGGGRPKLVHTLNGSGLAIPRVLIAVMEANQQEDGSIVVPEVLRPFTGFERIYRN